MRAYLTRVALQYLFYEGVKNKMFKQSLIKGCKLGLDTAWMLLRITIPIYVAISILGKTPLIDWVAKAFAPAMQIFGLPGEAAMVLVIGNFINLYAAIGAIKAISLTNAEVTIVALMLSFSHNLFVETALCKKLGLSAAAVIAIRLTLAAGAGLVSNILINGRV